MGTPEDYKGILSIVDMNDSGDVLVVSNNKMASLDAIDVYSSFRCDNALGYLIPPDLNFPENASLAQTAEKISNHDPKFWNQMVIATGLALRKFPTDMFKIESF